MGKLDRTVSDCPDRIHSVGVSPDLRKLGSHRTLVLNADMQPLSWLPLSTWSWQEAVSAVIQERVVQIRTYDELRIRSAHDSFEVPSVVCLKKYRKRKTVAFTRYNLFLRDGFTCQYCNSRQAARDLTFDHVVPRSRGGGATFANIVAACQPCNIRKGNRTPREAGMRLRRPPRTPTPQELDSVGRRMAKLQKELHRTWLDFLYWDVDLES